MADETLQRVRRIETRLTALSVAMGVATGAQKPTFHELGQGLAELRLCSPHTTIKEITDALPSGWEGQVGLMLGDEYLTSLDVREQRA